MIHSFWWADQPLPAAVIAFVAGLTSDPVKQFRFLILLGRLLAKDHGVFRRFEVPQGLGLIEVASFAGVFDGIQDVDW